MGNEIWIKAKGFERYFVSNYGRIKTTNTKGRTYFLKPHNIGAGYLHCNIFNNEGIRKGVLIHRLVANTFIDNPNNNPEVNHIDLNKHNNYVGNLEWVTKKENMIHASNEYKGGFNRNFEKLTEKEVLEIRSKYIPIKYSTIRLAKEYSVSQACISLIINRINWKHI